MTSSASSLSDPVAGALCYFAMPVSAAILLVVKPYSSRAFVRFHAVQALLLFAALAGASLSLQAVAVVLSVIPFAGAWIASLLLAALWIGTLVAWLGMMLAALNGKCLALPVIGPIARRHS
jgi:uncharacterized membrane protein